MVIIAADFTEDLIVGFGWKIVDCSHVVGWYSNVWCRPIPRWTVISNEHCVDIEPYLLVTIFQMLEESWKEAE